jgi:hypothetical protein
VRRSNRAKGPFTNDVGGYYSRALNITDIRHVFIIIADRLATISMVGLPEIDRQFILRWSRPVGGNRHVVLNTLKNVFEPTILRYTVSVLKHSFHLAVCRYREFFDI